MERLAADTFDVRDAVILSQDLKQAVYIVGVNGEVVISVGIEVDTSLVSDDFDEGSTVDYPTTTVTPPDWTHS